MNSDLQCASSMIDALETDATTKASMLRALARRLDLFGSDILFFNEPFTPVSLTGSRCALSCKHCNSHYLRHMLDGSGGKLQTEASKLANRGAKGILLSGGSAADGSVPTYEQSDVIQKIKHDTKLKISAHTGIVNSSQARILSEYLDMALVDVLGDDETIHDVLGIDARVQDYEESLRRLFSLGIPLAPHIIVGLRDGQLKGEFKALEMVKKFNPVTVVIVVFIPTKATAMGDVFPPKIEDVAKVITTAREMFDVPLSLSCVRPGGRYRSLLDRYAILGGIDRIAVPSRKAYAASRELGLNIIEIPKMCCSYGVVR
ncbi:Radical SAM superfamily protein [uncultured archaeon]|nr:Radical SAM superfamily protein [uncultured archaeon]